MELEISKRQIKKAGLTLIDLDATPGDYYEAYQILSQWRAAHSYPLHVVSSLLSRKAKSIDLESVVVRRLKRGRSIIFKLFRERGMDLRRMEDIAGCRAVVKTQREVRLVKKSLINSSTSNILKRERNYVETPKTSGYRGIHLIYQYGGSKTKFTGIPVEIQLRSKIQHSWATAVEVVGTFTRQALKASDGSQEWLDFFFYTSAQFALLEKCPMPAGTSEEESRERVKYLAEKLEVSLKLRAYSVSVEQMSSQTNAKFYILLLNSKTYTLKIKPFKSSERSEALDDYQMFERKYRKNNSVDTVLVAADSIKSLRAAYPNYFADTKVFNANLKRVLS